MTRRLGLLFTLNVALEDWRRQGLLEREAQVYDDLLTLGVYDEIYWFTNGPDNPSDRRGLPDRVSIIPMPRFLNHPLGKLLYSLLMPLLHARQLNACTVLKTNQLPGAWTAVLAARLFSKPLILRAGYLWSWTARKNKEATGRFTRKLDCIASLVERWAYSRATIAIVTTTSQKSYVESRYPSAVGKIRVIPNAVETERFKPSTPADNARLIFVGRLSPEKNVAALVDAIRDIPCELDIYGDGDLRADLERQAKSSAVTVRFHGSISNAQLPGVLTAHQIFVLPSLYEGLPKALLEAMSCGLPTIGSDVADINQVIRHGENGWLCAPTAAGIREAVTTLLKDRPLAHRLGQTARTFIESTYSRVTVSRLEATLHQELYATS